MSKQITLDFATLLASAAHDMKNSLGFMLNSLNEIGDEYEATDTNLSDKLNLLRYETKRVSNDLVQLLTLYKLESQLYSLTVNRQSVYELLEEQLAYFQAELTARDIGTELSCAPDLEWHYDSGLLAGVITNVINNAIRYTRDKILLGAAIEGEFLVITIADNGPGYPASICAQVPGESGAVDHISGSTGLGLYFSSLIAQLHSSKTLTGYISLANDAALGGGSFKIHLPRHHY